MKKQQYKNEKMKKNEQQKSEIKIEKERLNDKKEILPREI